MSLLAKLQKEFGSESVMMMEDVPELDVISSGIPSLDYGLRRGGYPRRLVTEIFGPESVGKSLLAFLAIAEAQRMGLTTVLITTEGMPNAEWAATLGVDLSKVIILFAFTAEEMLEQTKTVSESPEVHLMIIDSLAAVGTAKSMEEGGKRQAFGISGIVSDMMHVLVGNCWRTNKACLILNQVRDVANHQGLPIVKSPGGHSLHHGASVRIQLKRAGEAKKGKVQGEEKTIGFKVKGHIKKNKAEEPDSTAEWWIYTAAPDEPTMDFPGKGIDLLESTISVGIAKGIITHTAGRYSVPCLDYEQEHKDRGKDKFVTWVREDPARISKIREELFK